jgi:hypothetical protein
MFININKLFLMNIYALAFVRDDPEETTEFPAGGSKGAKPRLQAPKILMLQ